MRFLRGLLKFSLVVLAVLLVPYLIWWVPNRIDEAPTPLAIQWFSPLPHSVPDAENAWLFMLGIDAADGDDPIALGRRRVAAEDARQTEVPLLPKSAAQLALDKEALPFQSKVASNPDFPLICSAADRDCIAAAVESSAELDELARVNAIRMHRFESLLAMTRFEEESIPSADEPKPAISWENNLYRALIMRDLADPARRANALNRLVRVATFFRRVDEQAQSTEMKTMALRWLSNYVYVLDTAIDHFGSAVLDQDFQHAMDDVLKAPTAAQKNWLGPVHRSAVRFKHVMSTSVLGPIDTLRHCQSTPKQSCFATFLMTQAYEPQATANLQALFLSIELELFDAEAADLPEVQNRFGKLWEEKNVLSNNMSQVLHAFAYNFTGKTLVLIAWPGMDDIFRRHDTEAQRRMTVLKADALRQHIAPMKMRAFLAAQSRELRDPYTGASFGWNDEFGEIRFKPKAKYWHSAYLDVGYAPLPGNPVKPCTKTLQIHFYGKDKTSGRDNEMQALSCAGGMRSATTRARLLSPANASGGEDESLGLNLGHELRVYGIGVAESDDKADVRLFLKDGNTWRTYEATDVAEDGSIIDMQRHGHDAGPEFRVSIKPVSVKGNISVSAQGIPARQLGMDIARVGRIGVSNVDLLPTTPVWMTLDSEDPKLLLAALARSHNLELRDLGVKGFAFARTTPVKADTASH